MTATRHGSCASRHSTPGRRRHRRRPVLLRRVRPLPRPSGRHRHSACRRRPTLMQPTQDVARRARRPVRASRRDPARDADLDDARSPRLVHLGDVLGAGREQHGCGRPETSSEWTRCRNRLPAKGAERPRSVRRVPASGSVDGRSTKEALVRMSLVPAYSQPTGVTGTRSPCPGGGQAWRLGNRLANHASKTCASSVNRRV